MIFARFFYSKGSCCEGFSVRGHSNFDRFGHDLVCCAVSTAVQMCCNGLTELAKCSAKIYVSDGFIRVWLDDDRSVVQVLLKSLELELELIAKQYYKNLKVLKIF